ncbi:hypothetical protein MTO96_007045 [Rhipicephalus appendiculatus]
MSWTFTLLILVALGLGLALGAVERSRFNETMPHLVPYVYFPGTLFLQGLEEWPRLCLSTGAPSIYPVSQILQALFEKLALSAFNAQLGLREPIENLIQGIVLFLGSFACH